MVEAAPTFERPRRRWSVTSWIVRGRSGDGSPDEARGGSPSTGALMGRSRLRRLAAIFLATGLLLPVMPHLLGFPNDRSCFDFRIGESECGFLGLGVLLVGVLLRAFVASREGGRWRTWFWGGVAFVVADVFLIPFESMLMPHWYWDALR